MNDIKQGWKKLVVAEKALALVADIYNLINQFLPNDERYGLSSQIKRCAVSIPANIAEGYARGHTKEFIRFLYISRGSASELDVYLDLIVRLGFTSETQIQNIINNNDEVQRMISKLITSLQAKVRGDVFSSQLSTLSSQLSTLTRRNNVRNN